jgi:arabinofuranosyltransferase
VADGYGVGMLGYYAGPGVHVLDTLALGDPLLAKLRYVNTLAQTRGGRRIADGTILIGHYERAIPPGYRETLESGENRIADEHLRAYYERLVLVTRGPLFSWERWRAIWQLNTGELDDLIRAYEDTPPDDEGAHRPNGRAVPGSAGRARQAVT